MCTKKILYMPGDEKKIELRAREKGGNLNFAQISYATDCVREIANRKDIPMVKMIDVLRKNNAFLLIYKEARKTTSKPAKVFARELATIIG